MLGVPDHLIRACDEGLASIYEREVFVRQDYLFNFEVIAPKSAVERHRYVGAPEGEIGIEAGGAVEWHLVPIFFRDRFKVPTSP